MLARADVRVHSVGYRYDRCVSRTRSTRSHRDAQAKPAVTSSLEYFMIDHRCRIINAMSSVISRRSMLAMPLGAAAASTWRNEETRRWPAPEANQAVAVDADHFECHRQSHCRQVRQEDRKAHHRLGMPEGRAFDPSEQWDRARWSLILRALQLPWRADDQFIEMWDTKTMKHSGAYSFGMVDGSATWIDLPARTLVRDVWPLLETRRENPAAMRAIRASSSSMRAGEECKAGLTRRRLYPNSDSTRSQAGRSDPTVFCTARDTTIPRSTCSASRKAAAR